MDIFTLFLVAFLLGYGINYFVKDATLGAITAICALIAGIVGLVRLVA